MNEYQDALALLRRAAGLMESVDETLITAHLATPLAMLEERVQASGARSAADISDEPADGGRHASD